MCTRPLLVAYPIPPYLPLPFLHCRAESPQLSSEARLPCCTQCFPLQDSAGAWCGPARQTSQASRLGKPEISCDEFCAPDPHQPPAALQRHTLLNAAFANGLGFTRRAERRLPKDRELGQRQNRSLLRKKKVRTRPLRPITPCASACDGCTVPPAGVSSPPCSPCYHRAWLWLGLAALHLHSQHVSARRLRPQPAALHGLAELLRPSDGRPCGRYGFKKR